MARTSSPARPTPNLPYDLLKDFEPLTLICITPFMVVSRKGVPAKDLKSFIAWLKDNPNKTVGTARPGQHQPRLRPDLPDRYRHQASVRAVSRHRAGHAGHRGRPIDAIISDPVATLQQVRAGNVQAYAVCADKRLPSAPDIPTVDEAGLPGYHVALWHGLWLPRGTPKPIMDRLHAAAVEALADPAVRSKLGVARAGHLPARAPDTAGARQPSRRPRSKSGGRSSRPATSRWNKPPQTVAASPARERR